MEPLVIVVDDDEAMRDSLSYLIRATGRTVACHASAEDFLANTDLSRPGCLILDIRMPGMSGLDLQKLLKERRSPLSVLIISGHGTVPMAVDAMLSGAIGFLEKPFTDEALLAGIETGLTASTERHQLQQRRDTLCARFDSLTQREREVLRKVAEGKQNKTIAFELDISIKTVEVHRHNAVTKMEADSVAELARMLIDIDAAASP